MLHKRVKYVDLYNISCARHNVMCMRVLQDTRQTMAVMMRVDRISTTVFDCTFTQPSMRMTSVWGFRRFYYYKKKEGTSKTTRDNGRVVGWVSWFLLKRQRFAKIMLRNPSTTLA